MSYIHPLRDPRSGNDCSSRSLESVNFDQRAYAFYVRHSQREALPCIKEDT